MKRATIIFKYFTLYNIISIHALVKRATGFDSIVKKLIKISIHALVKRATAFLRIILRIFHISIHALVKRATYKIKFIAKRENNFNPRPREEGDRRSASAGTCRIISIHALVKRATCNIYTASKWVGISIHALVKRATRLLRRNLACPFYFNPRPREEGDYGSTLLLFITNDFNPRPREEGDCKPQSFISK